MASMASEIILENEGSSDSELWIEPWGDVRRLGAGSKVRLAFDGPPGKPVVSQGEGTIEIWPWVGASLRLFDTEGLELGSWGPVPDLPVPAARHSVDRSLQKSAHSPEISGYKQLSLAAFTDSLVAARWRPVERHANIPRPDLVIQEPGGKIYVIEIKIGRTPLDFAAVATIAATRDLWARDGRNWEVEAVMFTNRAVSQRLGVLAQGLGVAVVTTRAGRASTSPREAGEEWARSLRAA